MFKKELRLNYKARRCSLSAEEVNSASKAIALGVDSLPIWDLEYFHIFLSIKDNKEVDTSPIIDILRDKGKKVVSPKMMGPEKLQHFELKSDTTLINNRWGIPEPASGTIIKEELIDLVFIPLLAFDQQGHRVGYGKGYYDRFLSQCRPDVQKVGLCFFEAVERITDLNDKDISMDYCITPSRVYSF